MESLSKITAASLLLALMSGCAATAETKQAGVSADAVTAESLRWKPNDTARPVPPRAEPKSEADLAASAQAPAGATVLFDGHGLAAWNPTKWKATPDYVEVTPKAGYLVSTEAFGSCHLHLEWWTPATPPLKSGQNRGNSGVFLMGLYEIQVLDCVDNPTYADGMAGAVYGQHPPRVNACRAPGNWQYYDIVFHRPVFAGASLVSPATVTVDFNGVRVQDGVKIMGPTSWQKRPPYVAHADRLPLKLQEHNEAVRYRNIWIVPIAD